MTPVSGSLTISFSILATTSASWLVSTLLLRLHSLHPLQEEQAGAGWTPSSSASMKSMVGPERVERKKHWTGRGGGGAAREARSTSEEKRGLGEARREEYPVSTHPGENLVLQRRRSWCSRPSVQWSLRSRIPRRRCTAPCGRWNAAAAAGGAPGKRWASLEASGAACTSVRLGMPMASILCASPCMSTTSSWKTVVGRSRYSSSNTRMKSVWGVPGSWSLLASSSEMKLSVEPLSAIISAEVEAVPQGERTGTSNSSNRLPAPGIEGAWEEGCALGALEVARDWQ